jgi:hypothetical protein
MAAARSWESMQGDPSIARLKELVHQSAKLTSKAEVRDPQLSALLDLGWLDRAISRTSSLFTIIVIGQVSSGKSSVINSLLGRKLLLPSDRPTDGVVSVLQATSPGEFEHAEKVLRDGSIVPCSVEEATRFLRQQETPADEQLRCREVRIHLNEPWLRHLRIVNTPGLGDRLEAFAQVALDYLHEDESDLVVWTFFPDTAANAGEVGVFGEALMRRKSAVLGVVTRCLEGKEADSKYDPRSDPALVGATGVRSWIQKNLGQYLRDVILYDSHAARRLVQRMRQTPELQTDTTFVADLERSGYTHFQQTLTALLGAGHESVQEARVSALLKRCGGHAAAVATAMVAVEHAFQKKANQENEQIAAWRKMESEIVGTVKAGLKNDLRTMAQERSRELVSTMGNSAADAIDLNFGLLETLGRSLASWTGVCDSAADALNSKIGAAVDAALERGRFHERLDDALQRLVNEHLVRLQGELRRASAPSDSGGSATKVPIDAGRPAGAVHDVLGSALVGATKGVTSAVLKSLAKNIEKGAAAAAAKEAAAQSTKQAVTRAGEAAAKQAAQKGVGATAARIAGIITLVLIPFDLAKLVKDFRKGRQNLSEMVRARYQADRPTYDARIFDGLWPVADESLAAVLRDGRANLDQRSGALAGYLEAAQRVASLRDSLVDLEARFTERSRG